MRKALLVGINDYPGCPLTGCENDATRLASILRRNQNGDVNFDCHVTLSSKDPVTRGRLRELIGEFFSKPADTALFFFAGHGSETNGNGVLVTRDYVKNDLGILMEELLRAASDGTKHIHEIFILLDCCHSGYTGKTWVAPSLDVLPKGVSILTASSETESAMEVSRGGVFTSLVCDALEGGAADVLGKVTAASVYSYLDQTLGAWEQRPHFKANLTKLEALRWCEPAVALETIRKIVSIFPSPDFELPLSPAYEPSELPYDATKEATFAILQRFRAARLLVPVGEDHLYYAARNSKACKLTPLGAFYWSLVRNGKL